MNPSSSLGPTILNLKDTASTLYSSTKWEYLVAGLSGGVASTLILHPLDLIKVRLQVNEGILKAQGRPHYSGVFNAGRTIFKKAGLRGLYQGVVPNVVGSGSSWGLYMLAYNTLKTRGQNGNTQVALDPLTYMWMAAQAGLFTLVLTNPIWVAKTRLCLQYDQTTSGRKQFTKTDMNHYRGMVDCLVKTYKVNGITGLYKGFVPSVFGTSHGAVHFMAYEELKKFHNSHYDQPHDAKLGTLAYLSYAAISKTIAASLTFPFQVVRARLQDQHTKYNGLLHVIKETHRHEGVRGFFKGMVPGVGRVLPATVLTFVVYENLLDFLLGRR